MRKRNISLRGFFDTLKNFCLIVLFLEAVFFMSSSLYFHLLTIRNKTLRPNDFKFKRLYFLCKHKLSKCDNSQAEEAKIVFGFNIFTVHFN